MCVEVGLEHSGRDEAATAQVTPVRFLARVRAHMLLQVAGLLEAFTADVAPVIRRRSCQKSAKYTPLLSAKPKALGPHILLSNKADK